jgi:hypothetical protein
MNNLKFKKYHFKIQKNNEDGTKTEVSMENLDIKHEMILIELIDNYVETRDVEDANKLFEYLKSK